MQEFDFFDLIERHSVDFEVINNGRTQYDELGEKILPESTKEKKRGAIIGISERRMYRSDGVLTEKDKDLYMLESLGDISSCYVLYEGNKYSVQANPQNNHKFTGVWQYTLIWVSAFKRGDTR